MTTFCWLPPDSVPTGRRGVGVAMRSLSIIVRAALRALARHENPGRKHLAQARQHDVVADRARQREALCLAVLRDQRHTAARRGFDRFRDRLAEQSDLAGGYPVGAEDRARHLGAAGADQSAQADDFAGAHGQIDVGKAAGGPTDL